MEDSRFNNTFMEIRFFDQTIEDFITRLEKPVLAKTLRTLDLLEQFGNRLGMPHSKKIGLSLFELRVRSKQEIRIFYTFSGGAIILLLGFIKKSQQTPKRCIDLAKKRLNSIDHI